MTERTLPTHISARGVTDVGKKRDHNEDSFLVDDDLGLFVVADGMGGHAGGGTASRLAVDTIQQALRAARHTDPGAFASPGALDASPLREHLRASIEAACRGIFRKAQSDPALTGMGTTVTAALVRGGNAFVAHVGDSRCYLLRAGRIYQISEDHSLVNEQVKAGTLTPEEARTSRFKNIITRSVGFEEEVQVDLLGVEAEKGDVLVLCSDGLSNMVQDHELLRLASSAPAQESTRSLVELANERGGDDNITVVVVRLE